jgi:hypothetical protein
MKQAVVLALATFGMAATAFAQAPSTGTTPGPHDPNPPMATPDLRLPPPCAPTPNVAMNGASARPVAAPAKGPTAGGITAADATGQTLCSANTLTQSAAAPGLVPQTQ